MKRTVNVVLAAALMALALTVAGCGEKKEAGAPAEKKAEAPKGVDMKDGKWEITTTMEMQGMPAGMMKPHTFTACLSQKDKIPQDANQKDCSMKDVKVEGNTVSWEVVCKDSSGKGRIAYAGSTYDGTMDMTMKEGGREMTAKMTMKGKHLGPCEEKK
jgi:hypothetical protein